MNAAPISEKQFTAMVVQFARLLGYRVAHFRPARTAHGWRTAVEGDGAGWPDLVLLKPGRLLAIELKVGRNKPTPEQTAWLESFRAAGAEAYVFRPEDWLEIEEVLGVQRG